MACGHTCARAEGGIGLSAADRAHGANKTTREAGNTHKEGSAKKERNACSVSHGQTKRAPRKASNCSIWLVTGADLQLLRDSSAVSRANKETLSPAGGAGG